MKKIIFIATLFAGLALPAPVWADQVCVQNYGQPVTCTTTTPEYHVPVKTGLGDLDIRVLGTAFITFSGILYFVSKRKSSLHR